MFLSIDFLLATTAIVIMIICYVLILVKMKKVDEPSEFSKLIEETSENLSAQRRMEMLERIKEERIREYVEKRKQRES